MKHHVRESAAEQSNSPHDEQRIEEKSIEVLDKQ